MEVYDMKAELQREILGADEKQLASQQSVLGRVKVGVRMLFGLVRLGRKRLQQLHSVLHGSKSIHMYWLGAQVDWTGYACNLACWGFAYYCIREYASLRIVWQSTSSWFDATAKFLIIAWPFWLVFATRTLYKLANSLIGLFCKGAPLNVTANPKYSIHQNESAEAGFSRSSRDVHLYELRAEPWRYESCRQLCHECVCRAYQCVSLWRDVPALKIPIFDAEKQSTAVVFQQGQPETNCFALLRGRVELLWPDVSAEPIMTFEKGSVIYSRIAYCRWLERRSENHYAALEAVTSDQDCELYSIQLTAGPGNDCARFEQEYRFWTSTYVFLHGYLGLSKQLFDGEPFVTTQVTADLASQVHGELKSPSASLCDFSEDVRSALLRVMEQALQLEQGTLEQASESVFVDACRTGSDQLGAYTVERLDKGVLLRQHGQLSAPGQKDTLLIVLDGELQVVDPVERNVHEFLFSVQRGQTLFLPRYPFANPFTVRVNNSCIVLRTTRLLHVKTAGGDGGIAKLCTVPYPAGSWLDRASDILRIADYAVRCEQHDTGEVVCRHGDPADRLFIVRVGELLATSRHRVVREYFAGDLIGVDELSNADGTSIRETVRALGHCELICVAGGLLNALDKKFNVYKKLEERRQLAAELRNQDGTWWHLVGLNHCFECDCSVILLLGLCDESKLAQFTAQLMHSFNLVTDNKVQIVTLTDENRHCLAAHTQDGVHDKIWLLSHAIERSGDAERTLNKYHLHNLQYDFVVLVADAEQERNAALSDVYTHLNLELTLLGAPCVTVLLQRDVNLPIRVRSLPGIIDSLKGIVVKHVLDLTHALDETDLDFLKRLQWLARFITGRSIGLVLSGGGARGFAHLGVLQALQEANVPVDVVCGTSMGSFVGAVYSDESDAERTRKRVEKWNKSQYGLIAWVKHVLDLQLGGFFFQQSVTNTFGEKRVEELRLPYFCVASDVSRSMPRHYLEGRLAWYVRSSMNVAGPLPPFIDPYGTALVDGGYSDNMPVDAMHKEFGNSIGALIAVDVGAPVEQFYWDGWPQDHVPLLVRIYRRTIGTLLHYPCSPNDKPALWNTYLQLSWISDTEKAHKRHSIENMLLLVPDVQKYSMVDFAKLEKIVPLGYSCAHKKLSEWRTNKRTCPEALRPYLKLNDDVDSKTMKAEASSGSGTRRRAVREQK